MNEESQLCDSFVCSESCFPRICIPNERRNYQKIPFSEFFKAETRRTFYMKFHENFKTNVSHAARYLFYFHIQSSVREY